jgi:hypothetical protein
MFISCRKPGPTDLTWEESNPLSWLYCPASNSKLKEFVKLCIDRRKKNNT